ncbi:MAG: DUF2283 domain-containing protein [Nitrosomonas sp.]|nr:DUF2283 domain-containing protein [Nitrosomonas sp.]
MEDIKMNDPKLSYFEKEDILHLAISDENEFSSVEISPNITAELNEEGELIGIEIIGASSFLRDSILESTQAKLLQLSKQIA